MKKVMFFFAAMFIASFSFAGNKPVPETKKVDVKNSSVVWKGYKVTGSHDGLVALKSGELMFDGGRLVGGKFEIDMNSMSCTDLTNATGGDKLIGHLKSDDFFGTEKFPTATLVITNVEAKGSGSYAVTSNMTIKGKTEEVKFDANAGGGTATAKLKIDRTKFGVRYGSGSFFENLGDKAISNDFDLTIKLATETAATATTTTTTTTTTTATPALNGVNGVKESPKKLKKGKKMKAAPAPANAPKN